jgi:glycerophosphoryl diester phosphodiesterase
MTRFTPQIRALNWLTARPIAHRGLHHKSKGVIENTETAFAAAIRQNYAIECDLQRTADGEAVVFHDETLERVTERKGLVKDFTSRELKAATFKHGRDRIQTLAELLEQVDCRVSLIIELKSDFDGNTTLATHALDVLAHYSGPYCLMSFDPKMIAAVAAQSPDTVRGITADRTTDSYYRMLPFAERMNIRLFEHLAKTRPHFISYRFRDLPFAPVQAMRAAGHPVISWTIRSQQEQSDALRYSDQVTFEGYSA